jgi:hypothetical protein
MLTAGKGILNADGKRIIAASGRSILARGDDDGACYIVLAPCCEYDPPAPDLVARSCDVADIWVINSFTGPKVVRYTTGGDWCYTIDPDAAKNLCPPGYTVLELTEVSTDYVYVCEVGDCLCEEPTSACTCYYIYQSVYNCETDTFGTPSLINTLKIETTGTGTGCDDISALAGALSGIGSITSTADSKVWILVALPAGNTLTFVTAVESAEIAPADDCPASPGAPATPTLAAGTEPSDYIGALDAEPEPCGNVPPP